MSFRVLASIYSHGDIEFYDGTILDKGIYDLCNYGSTAIKNLA